MKGLELALIKGAGALGLLATWARARAQSLDLPACEKLGVGEQTQWSLGIVQPDASPALVDYAVRLSLADQRLGVCAESWSDVLPRWVPWSGGLDHGLGWVVFVLAFVVAVTILWFITPRDWWRRTTLLGILGVSAATWGLAVAALFVLQAVGVHRLFYDTVVSVRAPKQVGMDWINLKGARDLEAWLASRQLLAPAASAVVTEGTLPAPTPQAEVNAPIGPYMVIHRLNLRSGPGVQYGLLTTLDRGDKVQFEGERQGDWWQVRVSNSAVGWSSSLWLRQPTEAAPGLTAYFVRGDVAAGALDHETAA